jgi:hypothetical protein
VAGLDPLPACDEGLLSGIRPEARIEKRSSMRVLRTPSQWTEIAVLGTRDAPTVGKPDAYAAAFFTQPLHHPAEVTLFPGNIVQGPITSPGLA